MEAWSSLPLEAAAMRWRPLEKWTPPAAEIRQLSCFCRMERPRAGENSRSELEEVAASFDAILARQLLREMRDSVLKSSLFGDGLASEVYQEMFDDYLAEAIGKAGGLGLGKRVVEQLEPDQPRLTREEAIQLYEKQTLKGINRADRAEVEK